MRGRIQEHVYVRAVWPLALTACLACSQDAGAPGEDASAGSGDSSSGGSEAPSGGEAGSSTPESGPSEQDAPASASGTDGAIDAGSSAEAGSDACAGLLCEDFEEGSLDTAKWNLQMGGAGTEAIQQQTVAHGKYAMHVHGSGASSDFALIMTKAAPAGLVGSGPIFGRAYLYTEATINSVHTELVFAGTTGFPNLNYMEFAQFGANGSWQLGFDLFTPAPSIAPGFVEEAAYPPAGNLMPVMTWSCIQWEFDDQPDMMLLSVDGTQIDQFDANHISYASGPTTPGSVLNGKSSGIIGGFAVFGFGFHAWHPSNAFDVYYDDIVLDTKVVPCLP